MLNSDFQKLSVSGLVTLYELDATKLGAGILRWHGHVSFEDWQIIDPEQTKVKSDIIWQGQTYSPISIESEGLEMRGDGKASMPRMSVANNINGTQGAVSALCLRYDDFAGAKLTVIHTMAKYLDAANFAGGNPQASNEFKKQLWYVEQKISENSSAVSFELSNPVDFEGARIPTREITSFCHWGVHGRYRGEECGYTGAAMFTAEGEPTDDPSKDYCGCRLSDCRLRNNEGRFGGFPSSSLIAN
jgi:lambda family phage minor tail protein L